MQKENWNKIFGISDTKFEELFQYLLSQGIIKLNKDIYVFEFVGIIKYEDLIICGYPKYFNNEGILIEKFINILKVLEIYNHRNNSSIMTTELVEDGFYEQDIETNNQVWNMYMTILNDYFRNGLYIKEKNIFLHNSDNEINWNRTIEQGNEIIQEDVPIYLDCISETTVVNEQNYIKKVHSAIIKDIIYNLKPLSEFQIVDIPLDIQEKQIDLDELGGKDYIIYMIDNELTQQFSDRKINILNLMKTYINNCSKIEVTNNIKIFGTKYFYVIWEKVCQHIFNNMFDEKMKSIMPTPKWYSNEYNRFVKTETLIPDIVYINSDNKTVIILDAKYYNIKYINSGSSIEGNPGLGDINKQFLYEKILKNAIDIDDYDIYNAFIMPMDNDEKLLDNIGFVSFSELFPSEKNINIIKLNANNAFKMYITHNKFNMEEIEKIF